MKMKHRIYTFFVSVIIILISIFWRDVARVVIFIVKNEVFVYNFYCSTEGSNCITVVGKSRFEVNPDTSYYFYIGINEFIPYFDEEYAYIEHTSQFCIDVHKERAHIYTNEFVHVIRDSGKFTVLPYDRSSCSN